MKNREPRIRVPFWLVYAIIVCTLLIYWRLM
jgi:hypothetical protein